MFFEGWSYYRTNTDADEAFDVENSSIIAPESRDEAELNKEQFYKILRQQTGDDAEKGAPAYEDIVPVKDAKDRAPAKTPRTEIQTTTVRTELQPTTLKMEIY